MATRHLSRREFLQSVGIASAGLVMPLTGSGAAERTQRATSAKSTASLIGSIERVVLWNGRKTGKTWFQPRACVIPGSAPGKRTVFMTLQAITGSDNYGTVHWTTSNDLGRTWTEPKAIAAFQRSEIDGGLEEGVCDVVPQWHPSSGSIIAMGHNVYYRANKLTKPAEDRFPVYAIWKAGAWSGRQRLEWTDPRGTAIYTCGCGERLLVGDSDILVPISFGPKERKDRMVTTFRCSFDGTTLRVQEVGNELTLPTGRGLLEPSLTKWGGEYFLTIRAEDEHGYATRSSDGLHWGKLQAWAFEDAEPLAMSTTQQHWLPHSRVLHLVYTRKTPSNPRVLRWRAPLLIAAVDAKSLRLIRSTEQVLLPMDTPDQAHTARFGNFHPLALSAEESCVTVGEERSGDGWKGDTLMARVRWTEPNGLAPN